MNALIYLVGALLWLFCVIDTLRRQREYVWILLLLLAPPLGIILYLLNFYAIEGAGWRRLDVMFHEWRRMRQLQRQLPVNNIFAHRVELAMIYISQGRFLDCLKVLKPAIDQDPEDLRSQFLAGKALVKLNRAPEATPHLEYVVQAEPFFDFGEALVLLGSAYEATGQPDQAVAMYEKLFQKFRYAEAVVRRALILEGRGDRETARRDLEQLLRESEAAPGFSRRNERLWLRQARAVLRKLS